MAHTDKQPQTVYVESKKECTGYALSWLDVNLEKITNILLHTPEELEALKAKWMREAAEKVFKDLDIPSQINGSPNRYLDQHYPLPQQINTNL